MKARQRMGEKVLCIGGPFDNEDILLRRPFGTLPFTVSKAGIRWSGYYKERLPQIPATVEWERLSVKVPCPCCGTIVDEEKVQ
jgi:hypothetical protein